MIAVDPVLLRAFGFKKLKSEIEQWENKELGVFYCTNAHSRAAFAKILRHAIAKKTCDVVSENGYKIANKVFIIIYQKY